MTIEKDEELEQEAHRWISHLVSGEATTLDAESLKKWRRQSRMHEEAFRAAATRWNDFGSAGRDLLSEGKIAPWMQRQSSLGRRAVLAGGSALAASMVAVAVVKPPFGLWPSWSELSADYRTATGEQRDIRLADNVLARLNTQTSLAIEPSSRDRVTLISGEASFLLKPASVAFGVVAGNGVTTTKAGHFDVRNTGLSVCVTCLNGEVSIDREGEASHLKAGQQVRYNANSFDQILDIDPVQASAWQDGMLIFRDTPLEDVIAEINRYRPGRVILTRSDLEKVPVNGRFKIGRVEDVLVWIEQAFDAQARRLPGGVVLLG